MRLDLLVVGLVAMATASATAQEREIELGERAAKADLVLRVFDVRDLAPDAKSLEEIIAGMKGVVGPGEETTVSSPGAGTVVVRATPEAQERVARFLDSRRKVVEKSFVFLNMRVIRTEKSVLPFGDDRGAQVLFSQDRIPKLLEAIKSASKTEVLVAPRIGCLDGQRANLSITTQVAYVKDYEILVNEAGDSMADPIIGTLTEGLTVETTPRTTEFGVRLDLAATLRVLQRPIKEFEVKLEGSAVPVKIQLPELAVTKAAARGIFVPEGKALYFSLGRVKRADGKGTEALGLIIEVATLDDE